jgi:sphingomyelin phosphodiesterase acid-like 3
MIPPIRIKTFPGVQMSRIQTNGVLRNFLRYSACAALIALVTGQAVAQQAAERNERSAAALFVSDIHFEPFRDPGKVAQLAAAPVAQWKKILSAPDSSDRETRFAEIEKACHTRGEDTDFVLLQSSLQAIKAHAADAKFVTVSGDLISHAFTCKFSAVFPHAAPGEYRAFVEKTIAFVVESLRETLPGVPVYAALGNNDSDCGDYQLDTNSEFLTATGKVMAADLPEAQKEQAEKDFASGGYFSVSLPAPVAHARLLVLDDLFMSRRYQTCSGKDDSAPAAAQIAWMEQQLREARQKNEKVWVMAHIPPGVDAYSTATKGKNVCAGSKPTMFLSSEALPEALAKYGDVVKLAIFAHTHMDELRLLEPAKPGAEERGVAVKMVSSISPIDGNNPSFTVARIDPESATLKDYRVFAASNQTGVDATWTEEYDFAKAYQKADFSAASVKKLIAEFDADSDAKTGESQNFIRSYSPGQSVRELQAFWPQYVCALKNDEGDAFAKCACEAK